MEAELEGSVIRLAYFVTPPEKVDAHIVWFKGTVLKANRRKKHFYAVQFEALPPDFPEPSLENAALEPSMEGVFSAGGWHLAEPRREPVNSQSLSFSKQTAFTPISFVSSRCSLAPATAEWKMRHGTAVPKTREGSLVPTSVPIELRERVAVQLRTLAQDGLMLAVPQTPPTSDVLKRAFTEAHMQRFGMDVVLRFCTGLERAFEGAIGNDGGMLLCAPEAARHRALRSRKPAREYGASYLVRFLAATPYIDVGAAGLNLPHAKATDVTALFDTLFKALTTNLDFYPPPPAGAASSLGYVQVARFPKQ